MFDLRLSQSDPVDVGGLPRERKSSGTTERLPPEWFAHTGRNDLPDYGILLLDELPAAPLSVQSSAYQIALDGVIDRFKIKDGWNVFAAGNRLTDGGQFFKMPYALANRMCHIDVESDLDSWVDWAIDNGMEPSLIAFIRFKPDYLNTFEKHVKDKTKGMAFASERVWHKLNDLYTSNQAAGEDVLAAIAGGLVGAGHAAEYRGFRDVWHRMPSVSGIILDPDNAPVPDDAATQFAVATALAAHTSYDNVAQCFTYMDRFTKAGRAELTMLYAKDMQRRATAAMQEAQKTGAKFTHPAQSPAYAKWAQDNKDLFM
jgi:hypothetical protein